MKTAEDQIKGDYVESYHHPQKDMSFNLSDLNGTEGQAYCNMDRDKKLLLNGQIKTFRDYRGNIRRGTIYHNINNMWWVIVGKYDRQNTACFRLFDDTIKERIRRWVPRVRVSVTVGTRQ